MNKRVFGGILISIFGIIVALLSRFEFGGIFFGVIVLLIGLIIIFNDSEDKIEEIKTLKGGKKK